MLITADLEQVVVTLADSRGGVRVARHARCWATHQTLTDTAHDQAAARLRKACRQQSAPPADTEVAYRDLADYDRLFALDTALDTDVVDETLEQAI